MASVADDLHRIAATLREGVLGVAAITATGESISYNADESFPTASVIKVAIVAELYAQIAAGSASLETKITLGRDDFVAGSGVLANLEPGHSFTLAELARLTISVSDNTASNAVLRAVGGPAVVNRRMHTEWGMTDTTIHRPIKFHLLPSDPPHTATGTPADFCRFMNAVATDTLHSPMVSEQMRALLATCEDTSMIPRYLEVNAFASDLDKAPALVQVYHKTGAVDGVRNNAGIVVRSSNPPERTVLAIFTKGVDDPRWTEANRGSEAVARVAERLLSLA